jgi:hypothetical protein
VAGCPASTGFGDAVKVLMTGVLAASTVTVVVAVDRAGGGRDAEGVGRWSNIGRDGDGSARDRPNTLINRNGRRDASRQAPALGRTDRER